jgi:hypothetical protein
MLDELDDALIPPPQGIEKQNAAPQSRWLIGLHLLCGGFFSLSAKLILAEKEELLGAGPTLAFIALGYFFSKWLIGAIWKRNSSKKVHLVIGLALFLTYLILTATVMVMHGRLYSGNFY